MDPHLHLLPVLDRLSARAAACARETPIGWYSGLCEDRIFGASAPKTPTNASKEVDLVLETVVVEAVDDATPESTGLADATGATVVTAGVSTN